MKKIKRIILRTGIAMIPALFYTAGLNAQTLSRAGIFSFSESYSGETFYSNHSVGEVAVGSVSDGNVSLTQGFQQGFTYVTALENIVNEYNFSVFPNPASEILNISWKNNGVNASVTIQLTDMSGKTVLLKNTSVSAEREQIQLTDLPASSYFLTVSDRNNRLLGNYTIVKK